MNIQNQVLVKHFLILSIEPSVFSADHVSGRFQRRTTYVLFTDRQ